MPTYRPFAVLISNFLRWFRLLFLSVVVVSPNREDLEEAFFSAGGSRGAGEGGAGGAGGGASTGGGGGGSDVAVVGGSGGSSLHNRPTSSFALDPPHFKLQHPLLEIASGSGSGSVSGSSSGSGSLSGPGSGGAGRGGSGRAGRSLWQQQVCVCVRVCPPLIDLSASLGSKFEVDLLDFPFSADSVWSG